MKCLRARSGPRAKTQRKGRGAGAKEKAAFWRMSLSTGERGLSAPMGAFVLLETGGEVRMRARRRTDSRKGKKGRL